MKLASLDAEFGALYIDFGRPSIAPERMIRASLIQILFSVRYERKLMKQMQYSFLFRWFVGLAAQRACLGAYRLHQEPRSAADDGDVAQGDGGEAAISGHRIWAAGPSHPARSAEPRGY